jgi:hypothetical protein
MRAQYRLFLQLSGEHPLIWGEEAMAREDDSSALLPRQPALPLDRSPG